MTLEKEEIIHLLRKIKEQNDQTAKNELLSLFFERGCRWAQKKIRKIIYTDLIKPSTAEIASMVYQSFEKSIQTIRLDDMGAMSFQNYFYMMINYQIYAEMKTTLNYRMIPNYKEGVNILSRELRHTDHTEGGQMRKLIVNSTLLEIIEFVESKNTTYAQILILKSQGYRNREICALMNLNEMSLKSKIQYIKKLVHGKFDYPFANS